MNTPAHCQNCRTELQGRYCHSCGQDATQSIRFFGEVVMDLLLTFFSYDSRVNRTLGPLLFKPGFLSNEYIAGRRQRYLSPFRLYLFASVICFLLLSLQTEISIGSSSNPDTTPVQEIIDEASAALGDEQTQNNNTLVLGAGVPWLDDFLAGQSAKLGALTDRQLVELIVDTLPVMMLVLLPLLTLLMKLLYLGSGRYYVEHFIVVLHSQSFLFIAISLQEIHEWLGSKLWSSEPWLYGLPASALALWTFAYVPLMLRRVYAQSNTRTALKFAIVLLSYGMLAIMMLLLSFAWNLIAL